MRFSIITSLLCGVLLTADAGYAQPAPQPAPPAEQPPKKDSPTEKQAPKVPTRIQWESSFTKALAKAKATKKPVMVEFSAEWCPACRLLEKIVYKHKKVITESSNFVNVKVDVDRQEVIARRYGIVHLPTFGWLDAEGKPFYSMNGVAPPLEFVQEMRIALETYKQKTEAATSRQTAQTGAK